MGRSAQVSRERRRAPGVRPARRALPPRPRTGSRGFEDLAGGTPQRSPGGGRGAAVGPLAGALTASHPYDDAYGAGTPYARLVELCGRVVVLGAPLETVTLVHHAEAPARVPGKRHVSYDMPVIVGDQRVWRTFSDIDTSEGALPYERVLGDEDYIEHIARSALAAGKGRSGPVGEATAYLYDARGLVEHAIAWIERNFPSGGSKRTGAY